MASNYMRGAPGQSSGLTMPNWQQTGTPGAPGSNRQSLSIRKPDEVAWALPGSSKGYTDDDLKNITKKPLQLRRVVNEWTSKAQFEYKTPKEVYQAFQNENPEVSPEVVKTFIDDQILRRIGR